MIKNARTMSPLLACMGVCAAFMACTSANPSPAPKVPQDASAQTDGPAQADASVHADGSEETDGSAQADGSEDADGSAKADGPLLEAGECPRAASLADAGPTVSACTVGNAYVVCKYPSGATCECISDDPTTCAGCGLIDAGATCRSMCASNQYAVECGGPPGMDYQTAPDACVGAASSPEGSEFSCCPCE